MKKIKNNTVANDAKVVILSVFVFFPFLAPDFLLQFNSIHLLYSICKIVSVAITLVLFLTKRRISLISFLIILFYSEWVFVTIFKFNSQLIIVIKHTLYVATVILFYENTNKQHIPSCLWGLIIVHSVLTYVNFISVIVFPDGLYEPDFLYYEYNYKNIHEKYYFLGHNNSVVRFILPGIIFSALYDYIKYAKLKWRTFLLAGISMATVTLTWSNTGMIGCSILLVYLLFISRINLSQKINAKLFLKISVILFFLIVVFRIQIIFSFIIEDLFQKDLDMSYRTFVWDAALFYVAKSPIWGYGFVEDLWELITLSNINWMPTSAHNYFLDICLRGGLISLFLLLIIASLVCKKLDSTDKTPIVSLISFGLLAYFIMWQAEPFVKSGFTDMFLIFVIAYDINHIAIFFKLNKYQLSCHDYIK
jgi:O-antigen ligase